MSSESAEAQTPLKLLIGLPAYGSTLWTDTFQTLMGNILNLKAAIPNIQIKASVIDFAEIDWTRNLFATMLLDGDYDYLIMVDSDMAFPPYVMQHLIKSGHDVCGLIYPKRQMNLERFHKEAAAGVDYKTAVMRSLDFVGSGNAVIENGKLDIKKGFLRFSAIPTGCFCIRREVVVRMWDELPYVRQDSYTGPDISDHKFTRVARVFDKMIDERTGRRLSEDYSFCRRWTGMGGEIHVLMDVPVTHWGAQRFAGNAMELVRDRAVRDS